LPASDRPASDPRTVNLLRAASVVAWIIVCGVVVFWRLGEPSFWDPDEAHYAQASREMLASGRWLVPLYNGHPFFDKPILFYLLQIASFACFGVTEFAARLVPALASLALLWFTARAGTTFYGKPTGRLAALMLAVSAPFFALTRYAILDMVFACFLIGGLVLIVQAAFFARPRLQFPGYVLLALAVLTKGPVALVLTALAWLLAAAVSPDVRRKTFALRWGWATAIIVVVSSPWYLWTWYQHGRVFLDAYLFKENIQLFASALYPTQRPRVHYLRLLSLGLLPWTPVFLGRILDLARALWRREPPSPIDTLLWAWIGAVIGFFSLSSFRLDHYIFPVLPVACLLMASGWRALPSDGGDEYVVTRFGVWLIGPTLVVLGIGLFVVATRSPLILPPAARLAPATLLAGGLAFTAVLWRWRRPIAAASLIVAASLVVCYAVVIAVVGPALERDKVVKPMAQALASQLQPGDRIGAYRLDRWKTSWRFYVARETVQMEHPKEAQAFFAKPGRGFCMMSGESFDHLRDRGLRLKVVSEAFGLYMTTGRAHTQRTPPARRRFVIATTE
jgi:4-amino-4-deoxy-L-arabinose transferase-like glycosyltransferase